MTKWGKRQKFPHRTPLPLRSPRPCFAIICPSKVLSGPPLMHNTVLSSFWTGILLSVICPKPAFKHLTVLSSAQLWFFLTWTGKSQPRSYNKLPSKCISRQQEFDTAFVTATTKLPRRQKHSSAIGRGILSMIPPTQFSWDIHLTSRNSRSNWKKGTVWRARWKTGLVAFYNDFPATKPD